MDMTGTPDPDAFRSVAVEARDGYRIWLRYAEGAEGEVDLSHLVGSGVLAAWREPDCFAGVHIGTGDGNAWSEEIDLCPDALYLQITGKSPDDIWPGLTECAEGPEPISCGPGPRPPSRRSPDSSESSSASTPTTTIPRTFTRATARPKPRLAFATSDFYTAGCRLGRPVSWSSGWPSIKTSCWTLGSEGSAARRWGRSRRPTDSSSVRRIRQ